MSESICSIADCVNVVVARELCSSHYAKAKRLRKFQTRQTKTPEQKFWERVHVTEACWEWLGAKSSNGYGNLSINKRTTVSAHRFSYELHHGAIPYGRYICHACDNPNCVRPDHLFLGTPSDNVQDCIAKGRHRPSNYRPERHNHHQTKVSVAGLEELRERRKHGESSLSLAFAFGVSRGHVQKLCKGINRGMQP